MKAKQLPELRKHLKTLQASEEQQVKGGFGRIPGIRVPARNSRWDDIPFRLVRPRSSGISKELSGPWTGLAKGGPF